MKVSKFSIALSTSAFMITLVLPLVAAELLSPKLILYADKLLTFELPVACRLSVPEDIAASNDCPAVESDLVIPDVETKGVVLL